LKSGIRHRAGSLTAGLERSVERITLRMVRCLRVGYDQGFKAMR
jgi:hypothetical protein